jgi:hypothetical protein
MTATGLRRAPHSVPPLLLLLLPLLASGPAVFAEGPAVAAPAHKPAVDLGALLARLAAAEERVAASSKAIGFTMTARAEELDRKGNPETVHESVERIRTVDGKSDSELIRASTDGKDETAEERKKRADAKAEEEKRAKDEKGKEGGRKSVSVGISSPFGAETQKKYRYSLVGKDPSAPDRWRIRFEPKGEPSPELLTGEAIVDAAAGAVIRVTQHPAKNPHFVDRMETTLDFDPANPVGPLPVRMTVEGEGGFLFIKKRIRATMTFSDWKVEEAKPTGK